MSFGPPTSAALNNERPLIHTPVARLAEQIHLSIIRPRRGLRRVAMGFPCIHRYVSAGRYVSKVTWWHGIWAPSCGRAGAPVAPRMVQPLKGRPILNELRHR